MRSLNSNKQKLIYMHILLAGEKTMCCMCDHFQSFIGRRCLSLVNFSHLMTCHISTHSHRMCAHCIILLMDCFRSHLSGPAHWFKDLEHTHALSTLVRHCRTPAKINGINKNQLVNGRARVRPLISLLLKLPFNVLSDATHEKCQVNWCHGPAVDITFTLTEIWARCDELEASTLKMLNNSGERAVLKRL